MSDRRSGGPSSEMNRRKLLEVLGLAGIGSIAGCSGRPEWVDDQLPGWARDRVDGVSAESTATSTAAPSESTSAPTDAVETTFTATQRTTSERLRQLADIEVDISFSHDPVETSFEESSLIEALRVWSADGIDGDVVQAVPSDATSNDVAAVLGALWGVTDETTVATTVDESAYEFTGGETNVPFAALVGIAENGTGSVFAVRAADVETAEEVARQLTGSDVRD